MNFVAADVSPLIPSREKLEPTHVGCYIRQKPSKMGFLPAQIQKWPHRWENRRTDGKLARTEREIARTD
jgi:hypothetical protein